MAEKRLIDYYRDDLTCYYIDNLNLAHNRRIGIVIAPRDWRIDNVWHTLVNQSLPHVGYSDGKTSMCFIPTEILKCCSLTPAYRGVHNPHELLQLTDSDWVVHC